MMANDCKKWSDANLTGMIPGRLKSNCVPELYPRSVCRCGIRAGNAANRRRSCRLGLMLAMLFALALMVCVERAAGGQLQATVTPAAFGSRYHLTTLGTIDWAHWGRAGVYANYDHKAAGGSMISGVTEIETNAADSGKAAASVSNQARLISWTDGTPTANVTNDYGFVYAEAPSSRQGIGYSFTVKADTTVRTLYVLAGGYGTTPRLQAWLSDGSAVGVTNVTSPNSTTNYQRVYALVYQANAPNQTLTVSYTRESGTYSVDLVAAWLAAGGPPTAAISAPTNNQSLQIDWGVPSNLAISAVASDTGGAVTKVDFFVDGALVGTDSTSPYSVIWTNAVVGNHALTAIATDNEGNTGAATPVAVTVELNPQSAPQLFISAITAVTNGARYNLTALGTSDWAHWGAGGVWGSYVHKASGGGQISDVTEIESVATDSGKGFVDAVNKVRLASWSDGVPIAIVTDEPGFIYAEAPSTRQGMGYSFTVPADTNLRTLYVLAGGYGSTPKLELSLSDSSAAGVVDLTPPGTSVQFQRIYTIVYRAGAAGQHLTVRLIRAAGSFSVDLKAAWLVLGGEISLPPVDSSYAPTSNLLTLRWSSPGARLLSATNLTPPVNWSTWTGAIVTNTGSYYATIQTTGTSRYFRLQQPQATVPSGVKWHPGHYVSGYWGDGIDGTITQAKKSSAIKGVSFLHGWWELETGFGVYNFSEIDTELAKAKAAGLHLMIQIQDRTFSASQPHAVPAYMLTNSIYQGGDTVVTNSSGGFKSSTALRFVPAVQDRMIALYQALGARYDGDPNFEAVTIGSEDSMETTGSNMSGYSSRAYIDQEKRGITAAVAAFPHTVTLKILNWGPGNTELFAHAASVGIGVTGPDLDPKSPTFSYPVNYQAYFGQIPLAMSVQWPRVDTTIQNGSSVPAIANYGVSAPPTGIGLNYIVWDPASDAVISYDLDVIPAINAQPTTQQSCPTAFTILRGGCDGN